MWCVCIVCAASPHTLQGSICLRRHGDCKHVGSCTSLFVCAVTGGACCCVCTVGILFISMQRGRPMPVIPEHAQFVQKQTIRLRRRAGLCNVKCCTHLIIIIRCEEMQIKPLLGNELCAISARRMQIQVCYLISGYLEVSYCITYIVSLNIQ